MNDTRIEVSLPVRIVWIDPDEPAADGSHVAVRDPGRGGETVVRLLIESVTVPLGHGNEVVEAAALTDTMCALEIRADYEMLGWLKRALTGVETRAA